jgi:pimeloyl-ACP methyl ester carboxylesterase
MIRVLIRLALAICAAGLAGCASSPPLPVHEPLQRVERKTPVIIVPGISGSVLRDKASGKALWGEGRNVLFPRDGGYGLARPIGAPDDAESRLEVDGPILRVQLVGVIRKDVYAPIGDMLVNHGYQMGDLDNPRPGDTVFYFGYDWRQDSARMAGLLMEKLENLRRVRGEESMPVSFIAHSNGAHICRWLMKYGGAEIDAAEAGQAARPTQLDVQKLILVGNSNGGSLAIMELLQDGKIYIPYIGRRLRPEIAFTFPSLYQDLPSYRSDLFVDEKGEPLAVDLYDAENWRRFGWSVFGDRVRKHIERSGRSDLLGDEAARMAFLRESLVNARRFQQLLAQDAAIAPSTRIYSIQNVSLPTPERVALIEKAGERKPYFTDAREVKKRRGLQDAITAKGDGHATRASQEWLTPREKAAMPHPPFHVGGTHAGLVVQPELHRKLLEYLAE